MCVIILHFSYIISYNRIWIFWIWYYMMMVAWLSYYSLIQWIFQVNARFMSEISFSLIIHEIGLMNIYLLFVYLADFNVESKSVLNVKVASIYLELILYRSLPIYLDVQCIYHWIIYFTINIILLRSLNSDTYM